MTDSSTPKGENPDRKLPTSDSTRHEDAFALTWLIGLAIAIVAGGYLFLAQSSRDALMDINVSSAQSALYPDGGPIPVTDHSRLAEIPAELRN